MSEKMATVRRFDAVDTKEVEIPGTGVKMPARATPHPKAPKVRDYLFRKSMVEEIAIAQRLDLNVLLVGPAGCGKTSLPIQIAAQLGQPVVRFNMNGETRVSHLRGQQRPAAEDGVLTLAYSHGQLVDAMRQGWWVVLDEIDAASPSVLFVLTPVLEEGARSIDIPELHERVETHPAFRVFATSNTIGFRARARSRHAGTNMMNSALTDRFGMVIAVDYPSREEENKILASYVPGLAAHKEGAIIIDGVCRVAERLRTDDKFKNDFSTRRCIQWVRLIEQLPIPNARESNLLPWNVLRAAQLAVLRKFESATDSSVAFEVICRVFEYSDELKRAGTVTAASVIGGTVKA